jgi:hypothetical protein
MFPHPGRRPRPPGIAFPCDQLSRRTAPKKEKAKKAFVFRKAALLPPACHDVMIYFSHCVLSLRSFRHTLFMGDTLAKSLKGPFGHSGLDPESGIFVMFRIPAFAGMRSCGRITSPSCVEDTLNVF